MFGPKPRHIVGGSGLPSQAFGVAAVQWKKAAEAGRSQTDEALLASLSDDALLAELVARGGCGVTAAHVAATLGADEAAEDAESAVAAVCMLNRR